MFISDSLRITNFAFSSKALNGGARACARQANSMTFLPAFLDKVWLLQRMSRRAFYLLSLMMGAVLRHVAIVFCVSVPSEVRERVVEWIAIVMAALHSIRARTHMSIQHQSVHQVCFVDTCLVQANDLTTIRAHRESVRFARPVSTPGIDAGNSPDSPEVRHFVDTLVSDDRKPFLVHPEEDTQMPLKGWI
jgi:hypothetical protein